MKKQITKLMAAIMLLVFMMPALSVLGQTRTDFEFNLNQLYQNGTLVTAKTVINQSGGTLTFTDQNENFTILMTRNSGNQPGFYTSSGFIRFYNSDTFKLSAADGITMTKIVVTPNGSSFSLSSMAGLNTSTKTWEGSATEVTFTGAGTNKWDKLTITYSDGGTPQPTTYTVTYDCNGGTSGCPENVTGLEAGDEITLADAPTKDGFEFDGWNDGNTTYDEGDEYTVNSNVTFTAQWTEIVSGDVQWVLTSLADLTANDVFVIVGNNGSNYAMSNDKGTGNPPTAVAVTIANDVINSTVGANIQWTVGGDATNGYTFYPNGSTETWLYCTATNNGVRVGTNANKTFVIDATSGYLKNNATSRYLGIYNSQDWRCYTSSTTANIASQTFAFYKKVSGEVLPPSISASNVEITYDATSGSIAYTINNEVEGGSISASTTSDWITLSNNFNSPIAFTCTANEATTARTATVTLTYTYNRETVTKEVTVTQAAAPVIYSTIPALFAAATSTETSVLVTFNNWVVSAVSSNGKNVFVTDNNGNGFVIFDNDGGLDEVYSVGDILSGNAVTCTLKKYNGFAELLNVTATDLTITSGGAVTVADVAMADLAGVNTGALLHYDNLTCSIDNNKYYLSDGTTTIQVYGSIYAFGTLVEGKHYNITGVYQQYNNTKEILPRSAADIEEVVAAEPTVTVTPSTINAPAEGTEGTLALAYENIEEFISFDYYFCDAEGNELEEDPDWIDAEINEEDEEYSLYYFIDANDGAARTAYLKVYTFDDEAEEVYAIVTVNQAEYVVDYATLPFEWSSFDETPNGITNNGVSISTYLKFDTSADNIVLKFNERPGTLTFFVKGNPGNNGWAGTFKVQTSVDGVSYTDLATYEELLTTEYQEESFANLNEEVRYIKWVYTEKVSGNVAVNYIALDEYEEPALVASITVNPDEVEVPAQPIDGEEWIEGTLDVTYANLEIEDMTDFDIQYYDAEGEEISAPDWIEAMVAEQDPEIGEGYVVSYIIEENEGEARTAYFKVFALGDEDYVYSNMVTVNQAAYVAPAEPGNWVLTSLTDLTENDVFVIVGDNGDTYAMSNDEGTQHAPATVAVTVAEGTLSDEPAANIQWNLSITEDGYIFYPNGTTETWLYCTNNNNGLRVGTGESKVFAIEDDYLFNVAQERYVGIYNSQDWRSYTSINTNIADQTFAFYKKVESSDTETYTLEIAGYGQGNEGGYRLIASPVGSDVTPTAENGFLTGEYDLYWFDQTQEGEEWQNYKAGEFDLVNGMGYLYASEEGTTLTFEGTPYDGDGTVSLVKDDEVLFGGWNLIGNPFSTEATIDKDFYRMNETGSAIVVADEDELVVDAMEGIFVIAEEDGESATFTQVSEGPAQEDFQSVVLNVVRNRAGVIDRAIVRFGEGRMLPKFQLNPNNTKIYITEGNQDYAIVYSDNDAEIPVSFKAAERGTYTINADVKNVDMNYLHIIDKMNGNDVDLLQTSSYTFEATPADNASRFVLVFSANSVNENTETFAFFNGSEWVISNQGDATLQVIDVTGRVLSNQQVNGNAAVKLNQSAGVYMLRLINGNNVMTQKIVVR